MLIAEESIDEDGNPLLPKDRIAKVGNFLRETSIDELMQLFNIVKGDMSFVGPRPALPYQVERYTKQQKRRLPASERRLQHSNGVNCVKLLNL